MVTTRSKARVDASGSTAAITQQPSKSPAPKAKKANTSRKRADPPTATTSASANQGKKRKDSFASPPQHEDRSQQQARKHKLDRLVATFGTPLPLHCTPLPSPSTPTSSTILAHIFLALLSSTRISHAIASASVAELLSRGWHDLPALSASSWHERCAALTAGGYARYREKTAAELGELAALIEERYGGEAAGMLPESEGEEARRELRKRVKEVKGMGEVGADIFVAAVQAVWPRVAPFLDGRSVEMAREVGLGGDVEGLFEEVGRDAAKMARLNAGLTKVRLEKRVGELKG